MRNSSRSFNKSIEKISLFASCSLAAFVASGSAAFAQCSPEPTQANVTTICSGIDTDGLVVNTNSVVNVSVGATVQTAGALLNAVTLTSSAASPVNNIGLNVEGTITGSANGILIDGGAGNNVTANINVGQGGIVEGSAGIFLARNTANPINRVAASITNSGIIRSTDGGAAINYSQTAPGTISSLFNNKSGSIGGIQGIIGATVNSGVIDGGSLVSGFVGRANPFQPGAGTSFDNVEGGIVRSSAGYALAFTNGFSSVRVMNAGGSVIENIGTGDAIFSFSDLNITNEATSRITTTGNRAINAQRGLTLTNRGVITGNISVTNVAIQGVNAIDNLGGTINGNVALSAFNDRVLTSFGTQTAVAGGITGTLDGGAGFDSLSLNVTGTKTIDTAIALPTGFEEVSFSIGNGLDGKVVDGDCQ